MFKVEEYKEDFSKARKALLGLVYVFWKPIYNEFEEGEPKVFQFKTELVGDDHFKEPA